MHQNILLRHLGLLNVLGDIARAGTRHLEEILRAGVDLRERVHRYVWVGVLITIRKFVKCIIRLFLKIGFLICRFINKNIPHALLSSIPGAAFPIAILFFKIVL